MEISQKDLVFKKAEKKDIQFAFNFLKEAAQWLDSKQIDHWQQWHNPLKKHLKWVEDGFANGYFYFVSYKSEIIGMFRLQFEDKLFWGNRKEPSGYIHSLRTLRKYKGLGLGNLILDWVKVYCRKQGKEYLRLDCTESNFELRNYYEKQGFKYVGISPLKDERLVLYQKKL